MGYFSSHKQHLTLRYLTSANFPALPRIADHDGNVGEKFNALPIAAVLAP
jgi:hypothetical protein